MTTLQEVCDPLRLKHWGVQAIRHYRRAFEDHDAPCVRGCTFCRRCQRAILKMDRILRDTETTVYEVENGVVFFTLGNILHAFFTDGEFRGKVGIIRDVARSHQLRTGEDVVGYVPHSSKTISRYLQRNGFRLSEVREGDFHKDGMIHDYDVLELT